MKESLRIKLGFASYDFSNSGYVLIFQSLLFPIIFTSAGSHLRINPDSIWGWIVAVSSILAILISPFLGKYADHRGRPFIFSLLVIAAGSIAALVSAFLTWHLLLLAIGFVIFNTLFELSQTIYDSFLKRLSTDNATTTSLSTFAWGFGYLGGALCAVLYLILEKINVTPSAMLFWFAVLFTILSLPSLRFFTRRDRAVTPMHTLPLKQILKPTMPLPWRHLLIYWIIADCVAAIMYFSPLYMHKEIGMDTSTIGALLLGTQIIAFPLTIVAGHVANKIGAVKMIQMNLIIWLFILLDLFFAKSLTHILIIVLPFAFVIGSTQAILRSHYAMHVGPEKAAEGFGFYAIAQKSAAVLSPVLTSIIIMLTGEIRFAFIALTILLVAAFFLSTHLPKIPNNNSGLV
ncbi:MAG: MFS transporter [Patescibacteria group bacterium]